MANKFDSANYPTKEPSQLAIGDRWAWKRSDLHSDYDNSLFTLKYSARREGEGTEIEVIASASGTDYLVEVAASSTTNYEPGRYWWQAFITRTSDSERVTIGNGFFDVIADSDVSLTDPRSHAKKVLEAIEAVIETRATKDQESYTINGRTLSRTPIADLIVLRDKYRQEVNGEEAAQKMAKGQGNPRHIGVRLRRG